MILDTHIFLWWLFDDARLSQHLRQIMSNIEQPVYVSSASVWEISTKYRLGKLPDAAEVAQDIPKWISEAGFLALSINPAHAQLAGQWNRKHRDPFDRMLAAQAKIEHMPLATNDRQFETYGIEILK